jgi:hypothetical protein
MNVFAENLFSYLSTVGTAAGTRVYPNNMPQDAVMPAVRYFQVSDPLEMSHSGLSALRHPRYQLECYADGNEGYLNAKQLAEQMIVAFAGYVGTMGEATVHVGFLDDNAHDNYDPELARHWVSLDVIIWHSKQ